MWVATQHKPLKITFRLQQNRTVLVFERSSMTTPDSPPHRDWSSQCRRSATPPPRTLSSCRPTTGTGHCSWLKDRQWGVFQYCGQNIKEITVWHHGVLPRSSRNTRKRLGRDFAKDCILLGKMKDVQILKLNAKLHFNTVSQIYQAMLMQCRAQMDLRLNGKKNT